ncbi:hypothetical protein CsSME_00026246 [Camellia sinensis var. sinensis]
MSELDIQIPSTFDPFAEANAEDSSAGSKEYVHIRIQQRNGRKSLTTVQGLKKEFSYNKILKDLKKEFCCNGYSTSRRSTKECLNLPCSGWHSEKGTHQNTWFLSLQFPLLVP